MSTRKTIVLRGDFWEDAGVAGAAIRPGMLVNLNPSTGAYRPHNSAGGAVTFAFARSQTENDGAGIDTNIASGDNVVVCYPSLGAKINAVTADTIDLGEFVESAGDGTVRPYGSGYIIGFARKASDLSGTVGRVEIILAPNGV